MNNLSEEKKLDETYLFEASYAQKRIWLTDQLLNDKFVYNMPTALRIQGNINLDALNQAFECVIHRHDTLRTTFMYSEEQLMQQVHNKIDWAINSEDMTTLNHDVAWESALEIAKEEAEFSFDLSRGPLFRVKLIKITVEEFLLIINVHHIISDGLSLEVLRKELSLFYNAYLNGRRNEIEELPIQYVDFTYFQKDWLDSEEYISQINYWKQKLSGELPILQLFKDSFIKDISNKGSIYKFKVNSHISSAIKRLSIKEGTTNFMTLFAAYNVWLYRYSNQKDLIVGVPVSGRQWEEVQDLIGFFINNLAIRTQVEDNISFLQFLQDVKKNIIEALANQDVPFEKIVEVVQPERDVNVSPIFQNMFSLRVPSTDYELEELKTSEIEIERFSAKYDILLEMSESEECFEGSIEYRTDLFNEDTIKNMVSHFINILEGITVCPDKSISQLPMLNKDEIQKQLVEFNQTNDDYHYISVHKAIENWAAYRPEDTAIIYGNETYSYNILNSKANQLAHYLQSLGVTNDSLVGICLGTSPQLIITLLAIQKAGGAYVPIDPVLPQERQNYIVEHSDIKVLITDNDRMHNSKLRGALEIVNLNYMSKKIANESKENLELEIDHMCRMYVIFTSGSTGKPKGVNVYKKGFENLMQWYIGEFHMSELDKMLLTTSPSFDMTQKSIYAPLMTGGKLVLLKSEFYDATEISNIIDKQKITLISLTPSAFYPVLEETEKLNFSKLSTLRHVFLGGEPILANRLVEWSVSSNFNAVIVNTYGPTECTDITVFKRLSDLHEYVDKPMPIGRPVPNNKTYVLNSGLGLVPLGIAGELCIAGVQVSGGYIGNKEVTKEKFVENPYGDENSSTLYRTGDIVRYLPDGTIQYLGRSDHQVKIRGFRIEIREIEVALRSNSRVSDAVVMVSETQSGDKRLVAYYVPKEDLRKNEEACSIELRNELLEILPDYMIPSIFIRIDEIPLSTNGKIERKALPSPDWASSNTLSYTEPRTELEKEFVTIWEDLLSLSRVGVNDNFFEIGGHSLLATQLVSRLNSKIGINMTIRDLFENPTIAQLAKLSILLQNEVKHGGVIKPTLYKKEIPLSFSQKRIWFLNQLNPENVAYNLNACYIIDGAVDKDVLERSFNQIVERHEILRTTFKDSNGPVQVISPKLYLPINLKDISRLQEHTKQSEIEKVITSQTNRPFDLENGPLINMSLLRLSEKKFILVLSMHHIIFDGWSISVLMKELGDIYTSSLKGINSRLPKLEIQYADYSLWQKTNEVNSPQNYVQLKNYWIEQLSGELPILELPTEVSRNKNEQTYDGEKITNRINTNTVRKIKEFSRNKNITEFMMYFAVFSVLLSRLSKQNDIIIGAPIAGRNHYETEPLIGCFINTLALRINVSEDYSFDSFLKQVRKICLDAYAHQEMPFEKIVEIIQPDRNINRNPIFDVMINLVNTPNSDFQWDNLHLSPMDIKEQESKFGLTLYIHEMNNEIDFEFVYQKSLYTSKMIEELSNQYTTLLEQILKDSSLSISEYSLVTNNSKHYLPNPIEKIEEASYPTVPELFNTITLNNPNTVAVRHRGIQTTYYELADKAYKIATVLQKEGLEKGEVIAIYGKRSVGIIASMLGVLIAGGTIFTIDKNISLDRRKDVIHLSKVNKLIFVSEDHGHEDSILTCMNWARVLKIHSIDGRFINYSNQAINPSFSEMKKPEPKDPAYLFFTSGTTGRPKGVIGKHSGLAHFLQWQKRKFDIGFGDREAQLTSLSFDVVLRDILLPLVSGATVCLPDMEEDLSASNVLAWMENEEITYFHSVPSLVNTWLGIQGIELNSYAMFSSQVSLCQVI